MVHAFVKETLEAPAAEVWASIRDFQAIDRYLPAILESRMQGSGLGAIRRLKLSNSSQVVERLEALDERTRTLRYSVLETPLAFKDYVATMRVSERGPERCEVEWSSTFTAEEGEAPRIKKVIERLYVMGIEGLKRIHERSGSRPS